MSVKVTYNGIEITKDYVVSDLSRPLPEYRESSTVIDGRDGELFDGLTLGARDCSFTVSAVRKDRESLHQAARNLSALFMVKNPKPLTFSDERDSIGTQLVRYAVPTGTFDAEEFIKAGRWTCQFRQHDPYLYGKYRSVVIAKGETVEVDAGGNAPSFPVAVSTPTSATPIYQLVKYAPNGMDIAAQVVYDAQYLDGSYGSAFKGTNPIEVDMEEQAVTITRHLSDATKAVKGLRTESRFFALEGKQKIESPFSMSTVTWTERWL